LPRIVIGVRFLVHRQRLCPMNPTEVRMTKSPVARLRSDIGATTAEYAVVTAAGCGFGAVLLRLLMSSWGQALLKKIFDFFLSMIGLG
jgi:hypothetical protein